MTQKASNRKTEADLILALQQERKRTAGEFRQQFSGLGFTEAGAQGSIGSGLVGGTPVGIFLRTEGDSMLGPFAFLPVVPTIAQLPAAGNDNTLDISKDTGAYSSHIVFAAGGSNQMDIISGNTFAGQILVIESVETLTQTISDESNVTGPPAGNIKTLDGNDLVLGPRKTLVWFEFSDAATTGGDDFWHQITSAAQGGILPSGTADFQHLEWDDTGNKWDALITMTFQNVTGLIKWKNAAATEEAILSVTALDNFLWTDFATGAPHTMTFSGLELRDIGHIRSGNIPTSTIGFIQMGNDDELTWRNVGDTNNATFGFNPADNFEWADLGGSDVLMTLDSTELDLQIGPTQLRMANNTAGSIIWRNALDTESLQLFVSSTNNLSIIDFTTGAPHDFNVDFLNIKQIGFLESGTTGVAGIGFLRMANNEEITWSNFADTNDATFFFNAADNFQWADNAAGGIIMTLDGTELDLFDDNIVNVTDIVLKAGVATSKLFFDGGGDTYLTGSGTTGRINMINDNFNTTSFLTSGIALFGGVTDVSVQMSERVGDPAAGTTSGKYYVKVVGGAAKPFFIGDGTAAVDLSSGGGGSSFADDVFDIHDNVTPAKILQWQLSGMASGTSLFDVDNSTPRIYTFPNITGTMAMLQGTQTFSGAKTFSAGTVFSNTITMAGTINMDGTTINIGNTSADNVFFNAQINSTLRPDITTIDVGTSTDRWRKGWFTNMDIQSTFKTGSGESAGNTIGFFGGSLTTHRTVIKVVVGESLSLTQSRVRALQEALNDYNLVST